MTNQTEDHLHPDGDAPQDDQAARPDLSVSSLSGKKPTPEAIEAMKKHYRRFAKHEPFQTIFQSEGYEEQDK